MEIKSKELRSASVLVESEGEPTYKVSAVTNVSSGRVNSFDTGEVRRVEGDVMVASWSRYSQDNLNVNFMTGNVEEMCEITSKISEFITSVEGSDALVTNLSL